MKKYIVMTGLLLSMSAMATLEHTPGVDASPSEEKLSTSRACFQELEVLGCGDPAEDMVHFRQCLDDTHTRLSKDCSSLMQRLFGPRK